MTDRRRLIRTEPATASRLHARLATVLLFLANGSGIGAWAATIPRLKQGLALSDTALGVALLAVAAGAMVAMPLAGRLGVRVATHRLAAASGLGFAAALLLPGQAWSVASLVAAGLALGAVNGTMDVSMNAHASLVERAWGSAIMSSFHAAFSLGGFAGALAISLLAALAVGPGASLAGVGAAVLALVGAAVLIGLPVQAPAPVFAPVPAPAHPDQPRATTRGGTLPGISALTFIAMLVEGAVADWSGVFLVTVAGASLAAGSAVYGGFSVAMVVGRLLGDRVVRRLGAALTLRLGAGLAALGLTVALAGAAPMPSAIGFALVGLGLSNIIPILFSTAARARPEAPGIGVSHAATVGYTGFLLGPPAIGALADHIGLRLALAGLPVAVLAIVAAAGWARPRQAIASGSM